MKEEGNQVQKIGDLGNFLNAKASLKKTETVLKHAFKDKKDQKLTPKGDSDDDDSEVQGKEQDLFLIQKKTRKTLVSKSFGSVWEEASLQEYELMQ